MKALRVYEDPQCTVSDTDSTNTEDCNKVRNALPEINSRTTQLALMEQSR